MTTKITWDNFIIHNQDARGIRYKFEDLCRQLFANENLLYNKRFRYLHSNPNNPGVEIEPIFDENSGRKISYQAKFFDDSVDYGKILHSAKKTVEYYAGKLDHVFLYCNKSLDTKAKNLTLAKEVLEKNNISLEVITNDEILDLVRKYPYLGLYYFGNHTVSQEWFKKHSEIAFKELGVRYNRQFNIDTKVSEQLSLFLHDQDSIKYINHKKITLLERIKELYEKSYKHRTYLSLLEKTIHDLRDIGTENISDAFDWKKIAGDTVQSYHREMANKREELQSKLEELKANAFGIGKEDNQQRTAKEKYYILRNDIQRIDTLLVLPDMLEITQLEKSLLDGKILFIDGQAGMGKSQLLANETQKLLTMNHSALLLLAGEYLSDMPIQEQIMKNLSLDYSFDELIDILESQAEIENHIVPILLDALNETWIQKLWKTGLPKIFNKIQNTSMVKLVLTFRPECKKDLFPDNIREEIEKEKTLILHHRGFVDNSVSAITDFLNKYDIPFTPSCFLGYEMTNPLFLTIYCKTYNGEYVDMPMLYEKLIENLNDNLHREIEKVPVSRGYLGSDNILDSLINELSMKLIKENKRFISKKDFLELDYWRKYGFTPAIFMHLLLREQILHNYIRDDEEYLYFAYDQMNDYYCAKTIFKEKSDSHDIRRYLSEQTLGIKNGRIHHPRNIDLFINACAMYAQKYHEECIDIIDSLQDDDKKTIFSRYINSFQWRTPKYIPSEKLMNLLQIYPIDVHIVWEMFIGNSVKVSHPLNADYFHRLLLGYALNIRDSLWTIYINTLTYEENNRLIQLVSMYNEGNKLQISGEKQLELLLTLFAWILTSSNRWLRDCTSKAMIEILKENFSLCKKILEKFELVNDTYVIQRLYGIVFGACCKRITEQKIEFKKLIEYVYNTIFNKEIVYPDALLRDYARLIIERYIFEYPYDKLDIEKGKIMPPYSSLPIPEIEDKHYLDKPYRSNGISYIIQSMRFEGMGLYGDFGRYIFQGALNSFDVNQGKIFNYAIYFILNELGYSNDLFTYHDSHCGSYNRYQTIKIERIGKKYQWIAMHHILALVTDHHDMLDRYSLKNNKKIYEGTWEPYIRDFDPTLNNNFMIHDMVPCFEHLDDLTVYVNNENSNTDVSTSEKMKAWLETKSQYFHGLKNILLLTDSAGVEWVSLTKYCDTGRQNIEKSPLFIWSWLYAYFVTSEQEGYFIECSQKGLSVIDFETASHHDTYTVYNREYPWAPSCKEFKESAWINARIKTGETETVTKRIQDTDAILQALIQGISLDDIEPQELESNKEIKEEVALKKEIGKILCATSCLKWEEPYDGSKKETISCNVPCAELIEDLNLRQMREDGFYYDEDGNLAAFDMEMTHEKQGVVLRKDLLDTFLCKNNLKLIWLMQAAKELHNMDENFLDKSDWEAVFSYAGNTINGEVRRIHKD